MLVVCFFLFKYIYFFFYKFSSFEVSPVIECVMWMSVHMVIYLKGHPGRNNVLLLVAEKGGGGGGEKCPLLLSSWNFIKEGHIF